MIIENKVITSPNEHDDGITVIGEKKLILNTIVDFQKIPLDCQDGGIDCVGGSDVLIQRCVVRNVGKALLCGNEDNMIAFNKIVIEDSIIEDCGRRLPEAQYNTHVTLRRCLIKNWGHPDSFSVRSFGAWAHDGGKIVCEDCVFWQDSFRFSFTDWFNHIGQMFNDRDWQLKNLLPGATRGLTAGKGGKVEATNCYKNKWWIRLENSRSPMSRKYAEALIQTLREICPK